METSNASDSSVVANNNGSGSAPRILNGFSIESILAKPDRMPAQNPDSVPRPANFTFSSGNKDYGQMCNDFRSRDLNRPFVHPNDNHISDGSQEGFTSFDVNDDQQLCRNDMLCTTPDSSCIDDPANMLGSDDGDLSEESGCKSAFRITHRQMCQLMTESKIDLG